MSLVPLIQSFSTYFTRSRYPGLSMKLRFRGNSLRVRLNQNEVSELAAGHLLREHIEFPGRSNLSYTLKSHGVNVQASFSDSCIQITVPSSATASWAIGEDIGLYYTLPTDSSELSIAVEKDLECIDVPADEKDPLAFPREVSEKVC